ncbi:MULTISPECIES: ABC transporter substrate-binding protein [unclassified Microbacterium]|uniref:ABC transporter substrate-binding protein n=1 Tax=unclassified Microbacterium TaxID=2609290 RepID=UPI0036697401
MSTVSTSKSFTLTRRGFLSGAVALGGMAILASCAPGGASGGGSRFLTLVAEPPSGMTRTFNPFSATARWVSRNAMYEPLMITNAVTGKTDPWLATEYAWNAAGTELTFALRKDVMWSDKKPFTADDVAATFDLIQKNEGLFGTAGQVRDEIVSVTAKDPQTVVIAFNRPSATALEAVVSQFIVPAHVWSSIADPTTYDNPDPVATGPFTTVESFSSQVYRVTRNPHYWQKVQVDGLQLRSYSGNDQISAEVLAGKIDWGGIMPDPDKTFVARDKKNNHYWWPRTRTVNLQLNTTLPAFGDVKVRKALSLAIDRKRIVDVGYWGKAAPANAISLPVDHFKSWVDTSLVDAGKGSVALDPTSAAAALDAAGYAKGADGIRVAPDGSRMSFTMIIPTGWTDWITTGQSVADDLKKVGVEMKLSTLAYDSWAAQVYGGEFQCTLLGMMESSTPYRFYFETMSANTVQPVGTTSTINAHRFADPEATALLEQFTGLVDEAQQVDVMHRIEQRFAEVFPVVPLFEAPDYGLFSTRRYTGFPDESNPYAPLSLSLDYTGYLVFPHLTKA